VRAFGSGPSLRSLMGEGARDTEVIDPWGAFVHTPHRTGAVIANPGRISQRRTNVLRRDVRMPWSNVVPITASLERDFDSVKCPIDQIRHPQHP
jgi:hypothetical protein